ncbi:MAG: copper resistance CopC/CopD family protein [Anaerolineales bacterium]
MPRRFITLLVLITWLATAPPASAHADIVRADPAPNGVYPVGTLSLVTLEFDEELEPLFSSIEVFNSHLERVEAASGLTISTDPHVVSVELESLAPDSYSVVWRVVSVVDGHSTSGIYTFEVSEEVSAALVGEVTTLTGAAAPATSAAPVTVWEVGLRWARLIAGLITFGMLVINSAVYRKIRKNAVGEVASFWSAVDRASKRLLHGVLLLWWRVGIAWRGYQSTVAGQSNLASAIGAGIPIQLLRSRLGQVWALQMMFPLALLALLWRRPGRSMAGRAGSLIAAAMLGSVAFTSHAAAGALWPSLSTTVDWLHLLANGAWIGGLTALVVAFLPALKKLPAESRHETFTKVLRAFSPLAAMGLILSVVTGAYSASLQFLMPADVVQTSYGWAFLIKLALVVLMLFVALGNAWILRGDRSKRGLIGFSGSKWWRGRLSLMVRLESMLGLLVVAVTATLTAIPSPPPRPIPPEKQIPFNSRLEEIELAENDLRAFVALAPNYIGWNRYLIVLQDMAGEPVRDAERVRLRFYLPQAEVRTEWLNTQPAENGLYVANGQEMVAAGEWQIEVDIRRARKIDARFTLEWQMVAPPTTLVDPGTPRAANWVALAGIGFTAITIAVNRLLRKSAPASTISLVPPSRSGAES